MIQIPDIPAAIEGWLRDRPTKAREGKVWPSDLSRTVPDGPCLRAFYFMCKDSPTKEISVGSLWRMEVGTIVHDLIQKVLVLLNSEPIDGWKLFDFEEPTIYQHSGGDVTGRLDLHFQRPWNGTSHAYRCVMDIKTKRGNAFGYLNAPKAGDVIQTQAYMASVDADAGAILYVDREGDNFMRQFAVRRDDAAVDQAIQTLYDVRDADTPPPPVEFGFRRKVNKGPDSIYLSIPWQVNWCDLVECQCKAGLPNALPTGVLGHIDDNGNITLKSAGEPFAQLIEQEFGR